MSLVNVAVMGSLVREPEKVNRPSGLKTTLVIAVKGAGVKNQDGKYDSEFFRIELWGKLAEIAAKYLTKGSHVGVSGRLILDKWQDKTGRDRVTPLIKADQISLPPPLRVVQAGEALSDEAHTGAPTREPHSSDGSGSEDDLDILFATEVNDQFMGEVMSEEIKKSSKKKLVGAASS